MVREITAKKKRRRDKRGDHQIAMSHLFARLDRDQAAQQQNAGKRIQPRIHRRQAFCPGWQLLVNDGVVFRR